MNEHAEVDIDLLADYIGGALDGADEAAVARLIADDPRWRETYDLLVPGMAEVGAGLQALGARPEPMPTDVAARLDAALTAPAALDPTALDPAPAEPVLAEPAPDGHRHLHVVPGGGGDRRADRRRGARRRRLRWAAPIAAAAGVLAFAGIGLDHLLAPTDEAQSAAGSADAPAMEARPMVSSPAAAQLLTTGQDYTEITLGGEPADIKLAPGGASKSSRTGIPDAPVAPRESIDPLERLRVRAALEACLQAIAQQQGASIAVQTVDYARFEGTPALIVRFVADGVTWAVAAGPECGATGRGADSLRSLRVG